MNTIIMKITHIDKARIVVERSQMWTRQGQVSVESGYQVRHFWPGDCRSNENAAQRMPDKRDSGRDESVARDVKQNLSNESISH